MIDLADATMVRDPTEAKHWEHLVVVVGLDHIAHVLDRLLILIVLFDVLVVEAVRVVLVPVRGCIVDGSDHGNGPAAPQILHEGGSLVDGEVGDVELSIPACTNSDVAL